MGRKRLDLVGQRFGKLTVISLNEEISKQKRRSHWNCKCDCGNEIVVHVGNLRSGNTISCSCSRKEDLTGQRFGRLVVIEYLEKSKWLCKCDCGNETVVRGDSLRHGATSSCGCYQKERLKEKWQDEEFRQMKSELNSKRLKEKWQDEEYRQMQSELSSKRLKEKWQDEEYRQMKSNRTKEMWQDEEFRKMRSDKMSGENSPSWKGGISSISDYLRHLPVVSQWRKDTYIRENNRCQLTGKKVHGGNSDVHHLYGFNMIVLEAHELHNIQVKPQVKDYTEKELHKLEEYVASWHKNTNNAVVLSEEVHMLFHSLYGKGGNTPEQFEEFRERYMAGEFKDLI